MKTAEELGYKTGDKFIYNNSGAGYCDWFVNGSTITLMGKADNSIPAFDGPAKEDEVGGNDCKKGDITEGYAKTICLTPVAKDTPASSITVRVEQGCTMFVVSRVMNSAERAAVFNLLNSQGA